MPSYTSKSGKTSGVVAYKISPHSITVWFSNGPAYVYSEASVGAEQLATLKQLARDGFGLSTYISRHQPPYERIL